VKHSKRSAPCHNQAGVVIESLEGRQLLSGTAFYVSPSGSDFNLGTVDSPWQHVQYAVDQLTPGKTVYLMQGSYAESVTMHVSGTASAPITISAYSTDPVYLSSESAGQPVINLGSEDYITIQRMFFQGAAAGKIVGQGGNDGLLLRNLYLTGGDGGIILGGADDSHNITIDTVHVDVATGDGIAVSLGSGDGLTIRNSQCFNSGEWVAGTNDGIYAQGQNITVQNVLINGWAKFGIEMNAQNVNILRTTVVNNGGGAFLTGNDMKVENSLLVSNFHEGLILVGSGPFTLRQNLVGFPLDGGAMQWGSSDQVISVAASGNIFVSDVDYPILWVSSAADLSGDYNLYYNPTHPAAVIQWEGNADFSSAQIPGAWATASGMDTHSLYHDPMFTADDHLTSSSPAIDYSPTGPIVDRDNKLRPSGRAYDLGPYEFLGLPDQVAPVVSATSIGHVTAGGGTFYEFTVTYKDNQAVSVSTLDGNDIRVTGPNGFSQLAQLVSVNAATDGKVRTARYRITPPGGSWDSADDGVYTVSMQANQVSDPRGNFVAAGVLGTFNVNAFAAIGRFGDVDGKKTKLTLADSDGTLVTFTLSGHGTGVVTASAGGGWDLNLVNTDAKTAVAVSTKKSGAPGDNGTAELNDINCLAAVKSISAKTTNLRGDLTAASTLASLTMNDVIGGQSTIDVSGTGTSRLKLTVVLGVVQELSIQAPNMGISAIKATRWTDTDGTADQIVCQSLGSLTVAGNKKLAIAGDFQADVIATSTSVRQSIGKITVANWLDGSQIRSAGSIGSVTVGAMRDSLVFAGVRDSVDGFGELIAGGSAAFVSTAVSIGSVTVKGLPAEQFSVINSSIAAWTVSSASLMNVRTDNAGGSGAMGLAGHYVKSYLRKTAGVVDMKSGKQLGSKVIESVGDYSVQLF
jgi:hypothetical protein